MWPRATGCMPKLEKKLAEELPGVVARISPLELGPPVGWPVQYRVSGPDLSQVRTIALQLGQIMGGDDSLRRINYDWMEPARSVRVEIDQDQARLLGLSSQSLSAFSIPSMTGAADHACSRRIYLVDVVTRAQDEQRISLSTLRALQVPLPNGRTVPLGQIARFEFDQEYPLVWRRDRVPTLTVQADIVAGATPEAAVSALQPAIDKLTASLPEGYKIATGGTVEESAKSQASVFAVAPLMLLLMLLFLMAQLHSFSRLAMVLCLVPMGLIGIVGALLIAQRPLGFVAILGILALMGMIARNAVILIEQIETERAQGRDFWNAIVEGAVSRFRPIMLTAISTVLGFIPIAPTVFWGPMAFAIMGGLFVATILTLLVMPALYVIFFRVKEPTRRRRQGRPERPQASPRVRLSKFRHCEERSDEAIHVAVGDGDGLLRFARNDGPGEILAPESRGGGGEAGPELRSPKFRHCEERSDEAIHVAVGDGDGLLRFARNDGSDRRLFQILVASKPGIAAVNLSSQATRRG